MTTEIDRRWEEGVPHHRASVKLVKALQRIDNENGGEAADALETGGSGDQGEQLMYLLDIFFDARPTLASFV